MAASRWFRFCAVLWLVISFPSVPAKADELDPALDDLDPPLLHIGSGAGSACPTGHEAGCPTEPNWGLGTGGLSIYYNSSGHPALTSPLILIIGIPNYSGLAPAISSVTWYDVWPGGAGTAAAAYTIGYRGRLDPGEDAYVVSGYNHTANNSNSFTNWAAAVQARLGFQPDYFSLYSYGIGHAFGPRDLFDVRWAAPVPAGTFAIAYGCSEGNAASGECAAPNGRNTYTTPFTHAGMHVVPEPASILLVGSLLIAYGAALARRRLSG